MNHYPNVVNPRDPFHIKVNRWKSGQSRYTSGDVVRGSVIVDPCHRPQRILIHFKGREKFAIVKKQGNSHRTYREKVPFFEATLEVFSSPTRGQSYDIVGKGIANNNKVELPFQFEFPHTVQLHPPGWRGDNAKGRFKKRAGFHSEAGFPLPPTYAYFGSSAQQVVEYYLEASLYTDSRYHPHHTVRQLLPYYPANPILAEDITAKIAPFRRDMSLNCQTFRLDPNYDPNEGIIKRMKHSWHKHDPSTPYALFRAAVNVPQVASAESLPQAITVSFEHIRRSDIVLEPPPVYLTQVRVRLISGLNVRVPYTSLFSSDSDLTDSHTQKLVLLNRFFTSPGMLLYDGMSFAKFGKRRAGELPPSAPTFSSYGLNLKHTIEVVLWVECAGEKFEILACKGAIEIRSGATLADVERVQTASTAEDIVEESIENTVPPPYEPPPYQSEA